MHDEPPLITLVSWVWIAMTMEIDNAFEAQSAARVGNAFRISLPMWTNGLRFIDDSGTAVGDVRERAGAHCNLGGLERWGWISVGERGPGRRDGYGSHRGIGETTIVRTTRRGTVANMIWPKVIDEIEERWRSRFGAVAVDRIGGALRALSIGEPWSPPEVNPSNGFRTGVTRVRDVAEPGPGRPLVAVIGGALTAMTLAAELGSPVSMPIAANLLRPLAAGPLPRRELPARSGVSKEAIAMAIRFAARSEWVVDVSPGRVGLTARGEQVLGESTERSAESGAELRSALDVLVSNRVALSAGLVPPDGCWRGRRPYTAQTERLVDDPVQALPWHPMVLHRGGWPDGA